MRMHINTNDKHRAFDKDKYTYYNDANDKHDIDDKEKIVVARNLPLP